MKAEGRNEFIVRRFVNGLVGHISMEFHLGMLFNSDSHLISQKISREVVLVNRAIQQWLAADAAIASFSSNCSGRARANPHARLVAGGGSCALVMPSVRRLS